MSDHCHLLQLPDELLLKIVQYIPTRVRNGEKPRGVQRLPLSDYRSVSLVCRRLSRIASDVMYFHYDREVHHITSAPFIRSIAQNPALGRKVKSLKEIGLVEVIESIEPPKRSSTETECLCALIEQLGFPESENLKNSLQSRSGFDFNTEAALIIALTPNIQAITLDCDPYGRYSPLSLPTLRPLAYVATLDMLLHAAQGYPYGKVHGFEHLRKLKLDMAGLEIHSMPRVLRLKSLVDLVLFRHSPHSNYDQGPVDFPTWVRPEKDSSVKTIRLDVFDAHYTLILTLVLSCKDLESFALSVPKWADAFERTTYPTIISELRHHQPNLQHLSIVDKGGYRETSVPSDDRPGIHVGSLRAFTRLIYLSVPLELLVDPTTSNPTENLSSLLPDTLETLIVSKGEVLSGPYNRDVDELFTRALCDNHVQSVLDACRSHTVTLKEFGIRYQTDFSYTDNPTGYANNSKDLARMGDVHFDFYKFSGEFERCGVHFDYVIKVDHYKEHEAHERLISVRRINGDAVANEYSYHLHSMFDKEPRYQLRGFHIPEFLNTEGEEFMVHRN